MADGSTKSVEQLVVGDRVLSFDEKLGTLVGGTVTKIHKPYSTDHYFVLNGVLRVTEGHPILSGGRWVLAGNLQLGDPIATSTAADASVASIERIDSQAFVYNFQVDVSTYVACGYIVHNKEDLSLPGFDGDRSQVG